jgi:hypothetical protein
VSLFDTATYSIYSQLSVVGFLTKGNGGVMPKNIDDMSDAELGALFRKSTKPSRSKRIGRLIGFVIATPFAWVLGKAVVLYYSIKNHTPPKPK